MKISFVTTNKHKVREVTKVLSDYPLEIEHLDLEYTEDHDSSLSEIASSAAKKLAKDLNKPVMLEDTGIFFEAYDGFPGALPKFVFNTLGFKGIFKLLEKETRQAYFKTVAAFCLPNEEPKTFEGIMEGVITEEIHNQDKDKMPYEKIFIPKGKDVTLSDLSLEEKNAVSQRGQAFQKLGEYVASLNQ